MNLPVHQETEHGPPTEELTPRRIVRELDRYIVGQDKAKRAVAVALRNRWRRLAVDSGMRDEITPNNIILIGATGIGKTEIARRLARLAAAPFVKVEATRFTERGYVGGDVESMIRQLVDAAFKLVREERAREVEDSAARGVEDRILDQLLPPLASVGDETRERWERSRESLRAQLRKGELDHRQITIQVSDTPRMPFNVVGMGGDMGQDLGDALKGLFPGKKKEKQVTVEDARQMLRDEEIDKRIDEDSVGREAVERTERAGIVFLDEIDKITGSSESRGQVDVSREGVQRELLPLVEGGTVQTKYGSVRTDHVLFIAAGAFHVSKPSDLIPELQGRFPIRVELESLRQTDLERILREPENSLPKQYGALLDTEGCELEFTDDGLAEIARVAHEVNERQENIGARRLHTIMSTLLETMLFELPPEGDGPPPPTHVVVDRDFVNQRLKDVVADEDLSRYIL
ncbi:MAG TPA: ATP-dependent protease ATPase subunit HslU [Candidatus Krumholzibacteria bacterium]|nr:ATP-dependent protease ATPase subunit HslU [Candidatus Krumholzibacteria bacterium]